MKPIKSTIFKIWNSLLVLVMLFSAVALSPVRAVDLDPSILIDLIASVSQDGVEIIEGGTIDSTKLIRVQISFGIPVIGDFDEPIPIDAEYVEQNDTVSFELSSAFTLLTSGSIQLNMGSIKVGTATFLTDPITGMVIATVLFDGDDEVYDGTSNAVTAWFIADFEFDRDAFSAAGGDVVVKILEKDYTLSVPALPIVYNVTKSGVVNLADQSIAWTVNMSSTQGTDNLDLVGLEFFDDLQNVGAYIPGSFQVDGVDNTPVVDGTTLSYVFPTDAISPKVVTFRTAISDSSYFATSTQNVSNTAVLRENTTPLDDGQTTVSFTPPDWITKTGVASDPVLWITDPTSRQITWTITANPAGASLDNVVITDALPSGLTFNNAFWQVYDGADWINTSIITPNASNQYEVGNISSMIRLIIVADVVDQSFTTSTSSFTNSATITWDGLPVDPINSGNAVVPVGYSAITKSGVTTPSEQRIRWTVNVDAREQTIPDLRVYDLLVYGTSINLNTVTDIPSGITSSNLTPRYNQKYLGDFSGAYTLNIIPIFQGATQVADLIEVTGLSTTEVNTFSFDSQVVNPDIFAVGANRTVTNTASLFSETTLLASVNSNVTYVNRMLAKSMLNRSAFADPAAGVNSDTTNAANGFNYIEKTAIFRISVNASGIDLTNATNVSDDALGAVTITDTLPVGWEFVEVIPGSDYLIFEGNVQSSSERVVASDTTADTVIGLTTSISGRVASFTFQTLDQPYVILVKARVDEATAAQYFSTNQTITRTNAVTLQAENWTTGISRSQNITISSGILSKTTTRPTAGELLWTVNYLPYNIAQPVNRLEDQLPIGIDLRIDSSGALIITDNIAMYEMSLNADGSHAQGSEVPLILGTNVSYDNSTRTLTFIIPDSAQAYRFTYITDITGEPGSVSNRVSLIGGDTEIVGVLTPYVILASDGSASLLRNGWIRIEKTDGAANPLANAEFTLFANDGTTVIKSGLTGSNGSLTLRVIPDGTYILRETAVPAGYTLENISYSVLVTSTGDTVTSSINGAGNVLSVQNFLEGTAGNLILSKNVVGDGADLTKAFDFTLTLTGAPGTYTYIGDGVPGGNLSSGDTISLRHGQSITVLGIPLDATYMIVEEDYRLDGYTTSSSQGSGTIVVDDTQEANFVNTYNVGNLVITKTVTGVSAEPTKLFDFVVTFDGAPDTYNYFGTGVVDGTISSGDTISLAHGQSITIIGLPMGATYNVVELDYTIEGYTTASAADNGTIVAGSTQIAAFTNTREIGNLVISKTVAGLGADPAKLFTFTLTFENNTDTFTYIGNGVANGTITSGASIALTHGQSITVVGLPMDLDYLVIEQDYSRDGYTTAHSDATGTIESGVTSVAVFTNTFELGNLIIRKTVTGNASSTTKPFEFTLTLFDNSASYRYLGTGVADGTITSGSTFTLSHNQSITIIGLPMNTQYRVVENDYSRDGYSLISTNATGTIMVGANHLAIFTNTRSFGLPSTGDLASNNLAMLSLFFFSASLLILSITNYLFHKKRYKTGDLYISKTVVTQENLTDKSFDFSIDLEGTNGSFPYIGKGLSNGIITSGDTISLSHGQSITIIGLPMNARYSITEADYRPEGYIPITAKMSGQIVAGMTESLSFISTKRLISYPQKSSEINKETKLSLVYLTAIFIVIATSTVLLGKKKRK